MNRLKKWTAMLQNNKYPCFLADIETKEIFYANYSFLKLCEANEKVIGRSFVDLHNSGKTTILSKDYKNIDILSLEDEITIDVYSESLDKKYHCYFTKTHDGSAIFAIMKPDMDEDKNLSYEEALSQCLTIMQSEEDKTSALLAVLGQYYDADKTYIYHVDKNTKKIPCVASWKKTENEYISQELSEYISPDTIFDLIDMRNEANIIDISQEIAQCTKNIIHNTVLETFKLENLVISVVENDNKEPVGQIVIGNRSRSVTSFRLLLAVTLLLSNEILKTETSNYAISEISDKDMLTGFYNRTAYAKKVDELVNSSHKSLGVCLGNVNGLKKVNSEFGYSRGDSLIKKASDVMSEYFKDTHIYRIAGDEFIAFFPDVDESEFEGKIVKLSELLRKDDEYLLAVGHAWGRGSYNCTELVNTADTMMYINKQEYYHASKRKFDEISDTTLSDLLSFLENEEFMIYLQPQVRLKDGSLYGAEALIRRFDKTNQKMVFPDQFIPLYEQKSVIRHIDMFVIDAVCKLLAQLMKVGKELPISVNLSRVTLQEYGIVDAIVEICNKYDIPHNLLVIEVTERVGLIENNVASALITAFKDNGFNISLDDFGCAYSNIVTLAQIEVDEVKIDKSLVDDLTTSKKNHILVKNVLSMCNELEGASTLAEGIEDKSQADLLYQLGCHLGQGYFYSRPIPVVDFIEKYIN